MLTVPVSAVANCNAVTLNNGTKQPAAVSALLAQLVEFEQTIKLANANLQ